MGLERMNGRAVGLGIVGAALLAGAAMYYLQTYAFYEKVPAEGLRIELASAASGQAEPIEITDISAIDATSSPLRFRACFRTALDLDELAEAYVEYDAPVPLTAPGWFDCYDAEAIGKALEQNRAIAFLSAENIRDGVDRVVAVFEDGRGFAWHQLNDTYE